MWQGFTERVTVDDWEVVGEADKKEKEKSNFED